MLFAVAVASARSGTLRAWAPDLPGCEVSGKNPCTVLPQLRLAIERGLTELLLEGTALPDTRGGRPPGDGPDGPTGTAGATAVRWLSIHINVAHLEALARHQKRGAEG